jgi:hypothetical protein
MFAERENYPKAMPAILTSPAENDSRLDADTTDDLDAREAHRAEEPVLFRHVGHGPIVQT